MLGGGQLQMAFLERGALDEIEIYVIPEILGGGRPLFPRTGLRASPTLVSAEAIAKGCVRLHYRFKLSSQSLGSGSRRRWRGVGVAAKGLTSSTAASAPAASRQFVPAVKPLDELSSRLGRSAAAPSSDA
jgi:hypothetical protein